MPLTAGIRLLLIALFLSGLAEAPIARGAEDVRFDPRAVLAERFPAMASLRRATRSEIAVLETRLTAEEKAGADRTCQRQALAEFRWRLGSTGDRAAAGVALDRVRALALSPEPIGPCVTAWFWQLDALTDRLLQGTGPARDLHLLDRVNDPARLDAYLRHIAVSNLARDGVDHRKEFNIASADLVRLILRRQPAGYPWHGALSPVIWHFVQRAQDPATGFFGERYRVDARVIQRADLSITFHMARYLNGEIGHWPALIEHLLAVKEQRYPLGWLDQEGMTCHNNYDVVTLFRLGWRAMDARQKRRVAAEIDRLIDWALGTAIAPDGTIIAAAEGESWPETVYFTTAFLDEAGLFDRSKRFWTERDFPAAEGLRLGLITQARGIAPGDPMAAAALARLAVAR